MSNISGDGFRKIAEGFRDNLKKRAQNSETFSEPSELENVTSKSDESSNEIPDSLQDEAVADKPDLASSATPQAELSVKTRLVKEKEKTYFKEKKVRVTGTHIVFGKYTYMLKYLAATKRHEIKPKKKYCNSALGIVFVSLLIAFFLLITGGYGNESAAGRAIAVGLLMLVLIMILCRSLKSLHKLDFINQSGDVVHTEKKYDKGYITRLEKAVRQAIEENTHTL